MAKLNLEQFKTNAHHAITDKPETGGIFSQPNQRTLSLPMDSLFYRIKMRLGSPQLKTLIDSIERFGQIEPIIVHKIDEGYEIINGHQRILALTILERTDVVATVLDATDTEALFLPYLLNPVSSFEPIEIANYLRVLTEEYAIAPELIEEQTDLVSAEYLSLQFDQDIVALFDEQPTQEGAFEAVNTLREEALGRRFYLRGEGFHVEKHGERIRIDVNSKHLAADGFSAAYRLIDFIRSKEA